jgi:branched-chain amino acid transport system substrate-binding protein
VGGPLGPEAFTGPYHGARAFFAALNDKGGINGRKIRFLTCDDKESPDRDKACAQQLVEQQKVFALVASGATDTYAAAGYINGKGVPDVGGEPIGNAYYKYPHLYTILGAGYPRDGKQIGQGGNLYLQTGTYKYLKEKIGVSKAAVYFYSIAVSASFGKATANMLEKSGIPVVYFGGGSDAGENPAAPAFDTDVIQMRNKGVDGIWNAIDIAGFQKLCQSMDRFNFQVKVNNSTIQGMSQKLGRDFSAPCRNNIFVNTTSRSYADTGNPAVAGVRAAMQKYDGGFTMHQWVMEGWAAAQMFTDGVKSMGPNVTRVGLEKWLNGIKNYTAGDVMAPFDYQKHDYTQPFPECFTISQWQDSAKSFVTKAPAFTCVTSPGVAYHPADDGS